MHADYNEALLNNARELWRLGDWHGLAEISETNLETDFFRGEVALLCAIGKIQLNQLAPAREMLLKAKEWGVDGRYIRKVLLSSAYNSLARLEVIKDNGPKAVMHFKNSLTVLSDDLLDELGLKNRINNQLQQLGLQKEIVYKEEAESWVIISTIEAALEKVPESIPFLIAAAEDAQNDHKYDRAIRHWQKLASVMQDKMPQAYYDRLFEAYQKQSGFPLGSAEEEFLTGTINKHELLKQLHKTLKPNKYFEIGVQTGKSLLLAECEAIGVDPMPYPGIKLKNNHKIYEVTSDVFFEKKATEILKVPPDLVFIDGMHLFEFVLRDFINVEKYSTNRTVVVIDDIFPGHAAQADRNRRTRAWTGDVWKIIPILEEYRPDLVLEKIDAYPTGLLIIRNLSCDNRILEKNYLDIVDRFKPVLIVPHEVIDRANSRSEL